MNELVGRNVKWVCAAHIGIVLLFVLVSEWSFFPKEKAELVMDVDIVVDAPQVREPPVQVTRPDPPKPPAPDLRPASDPPKPKPKPKPKRKKRQIKRSQVRTTRTVTNETYRPQPSRDDVRRILAGGAQPSALRPGTRDSVAHWRALVVAALTHKWRQPSVDESGRRTPEVSITLARDGTIVARKLVVESGNAVMDASVMQAVSAVDRIPGLPEWFLKRHKTITVAFELL